jgi:hypothetical protein
MKKLKYHSHIDLSGMTPIQLRAVEIIDAMDDLRISFDGGYPSEFGFIGHKIIVASICHDGAPDLTISSVRDFIRENIEVLSQE